MQNTRISIETWLNLFAFDLLVVTLVVLVIFMAITPLQSSQPFVGLPISTTATKSPETERDLSITIISDDCVFFGREFVPMSVLDRRLASAPRNVDTTLRIRAAHNASYGTVRRVVRAAREAGYQRVTFVVRAPPETVPY
jgi:biopolymer transport protein ExbD